LGEVYKSGAKAGEPKESKQARKVTAMIDYKSGRKGFYVSHEIQLKIYQELFEAVFPEDPIEKLYNFSPKDWRTSPSYNLKDQTTCDSHAMIPHLKGLATCNGIPRPRDKTVYKGSLELGGDMGSNYKKVDIAEYYKGAIGSIPEAFDDFVDVWKGREFSTNQDLRDIGGGNIASFLNKSLKVPEGVADKVGAAFNIPTKSLESVDRFLMKIMAGGEKASLLKRGVNEIDATSAANRVAQNSLFRSGIDQSNKTEQGKLAICY